MINKNRIEYIFISLVQLIGYSFDVICGGISLYITGVTILERIVELTNPPMRTIANGAICGLGFIAIGINPQIAVREVNTTGRNLVSPDFFIASSIEYPSSLS
jgi:hypothetical protein